MWCTVPVDQVLFLFPPFICISSGQGVGRGARGKPAGHPPNKTLIPCPDAGHGLSGSFGVCKNLEDLGLGALTLGELGVISHPSAEPQGGRSGGAAELAAYRYLLPCPSVGVRSCTRSATWEDSDRI
ncbi:hypothetical protein Zm00014a_028997 [Zea mays]|uniref:Uncharacterized protein n=1 Tax=Zea mays TaxID=4577 RepID=A0A3L6GCV8_MAIZE|nr:hypothetical protein Zm00014a_028997 [Zea mays]